MSTPTKQEALAAIEALRLFLTAKVREEDHTPSTFDFGDGPVPAHRHRSPGGSLGGWVADTAYVAPTAYVGPNAQICGSAKVRYFARVTGISKVCGNATIGSGAQVGGGAVVKGNTLDTR